VNFQIESEDQEGKPFAFGVGLTSLQLYTTNENWEKKFVDRTDPANKLIPMRKCATLTGFCLYFLLPDAKDNLIPESAVVSKENYILKPSIFLRIKI